MKYRRTGSLALALATSICLSPEGSAHGGTYTGSTWCGPPGLADTVPPGAPGTGGGYAGPGQGGGAGSGGVGSGAGGVGGPYGWLGGPGTYFGSGTGWGWTSGAVPYLSDMGNGAPFGGMDPTEWNLFWHVHSAPFIDLQRTMEERAVLTGTDDYFIGRGERAGQHAPSLRPSAEELDETILPALLEALDGAEGTELTTGAMVALAKLGSDSAHRASIERALRKHVTDGNQEIAETATLSLGILGGPEALSTLRSLAMNTDAGCKLVGRTEVRPRTRAFAVYGLALTGRASGDEPIRRMVVQDLITLASGPERALPDLHVAALIGIGLVPLERSPALPGERPRLDSTSQVAFLLELATNRHASVGLRTHAVGSLARLAPALDATRRGEVLAFVHDALRQHSKERDMVRQACVVATPELVDFAAGEDAAPRRELSAEIVDDLIELAEDGDLMSRRFAWIALGRIGGRTSCEETQAIRRTFSDTLERTAAHRVRPWAAIGCGILQQERLERGQLQDTELATLVRASLRDAKAPTDAAAYACAVALARDVGAEADLLKALERFADDEARGHTAVALGMIDGTQPKKALRKLIDEGSARPWLVRQAATGLALMGDRDAVDELVQRLRQASTLSGQAAYASALGDIGDRRAIEPLLELLRAEDVTDSARGFAAVALGTLADPRDLPWNACIADHLNYIAATDTLSNGRGTGVLDIF